jgi:hypothetical protein
MSVEDQAQEYEIKQWERVNAPRSIMPVFTPGDAGYGPEFCIDEMCGDEMPAERRALGRHLCTACQQRAENTKRQRG